MHRPGTDPDNMTMEDILCDFCGQPWTDARPMIEGHRGACVCGNCLSIAYAELVLHKLSDEPNEGEACCLCREEGRPEPHWRTPLFEGEQTKIACRRCVKQAAGALHKDKDTDWSKPRLPEPSPQSE
jgi:hypothetical protein